MSKKLAEGIDGLVLDCKVGTGAFMKDAERARVLCAAIRAIGHAADKRVTCVLTDMDAPIGTAVGNALEIAESIDVLRGAGPADTRELTVVLGGEMLCLARVAGSSEDGQKKIAAALDDGSALEVFRRIVAAQGGDAAVCDRPGDVLPRAGKRLPVLAPSAGVIRAIAADDVGMAALVLGAGRATKDDVIAPAAGIVLACRPGDRVEAGQPLAELHHDLAVDDPRVAAAAARFLAAVEIGDAAPTRRTTRILEIIR
jgi:thymidine phosphorylase